MTCSRLVRRASTVVMMLAWTATAFAANASAPPAEMPTYAVVSLIGDQFTLVTRRSQTSSRVDTNDRRYFPVADASFDSVAMAAAEGAVGQARPGAPVLRASIRDPRLFALQERLLNESAESHDMRAALRELLVKSGATHLLLVTKRRDEARFRIAEGTIGAGTITGIGFYVDNESSMMHVESPKFAANGFLAPYAVVNVALVNLATMAVMKSQAAFESSMSIPVDKEGADRAWDALSGEAKVDALDSVIRKAVAVATTEVLAER